MTEIKALDKLREKIQLDVNNPWIDLQGDLLAMCDKVEREVSERYMGLPEGWTAEQACEVLGYWPRWDDGSPCMFGDEFTCYPKYYHEQKYEVLDRLSIFGPNHVWKRGCDDESPHDGGYYEWNFMRPGGDGCESYRPTKRKPRTLESILCDALADVSCMGDGIVRTFKSDEPYVAELAAEIRELLGVSE